MVALDRLDVALMTAYEWVLAGITGFGFLNLVALALCIVAKEADRVTRERRVEAEAAWPVAKTHEYECPTMTTQHRTRRQSCSER